MTLTPVRALRWLLVSLMTVSACDAARRPDDVAEERASPVPAAAAPTSTPPAPAAPAAPVDPTRDMSPLERRRFAVETGLLPSVRIRGRALSGMTIEARMRKHAVPGVSIVVINDYAIEWAKGYGVTQADGGAPVDTGTLFQAGALSQPVSAALALALVQNKKLDLKRDVNRNLKKWKIPKTDHTKLQAVTLRTLLSRTSGLTSVALAGHPRDAVPTLTQALSGVVVDQIPTLEYRESGADYLVLQQLISDVMKKPFPGLASEFLLAPLGMTSSAFEQPLDASRAPRAASGHDAAGAPLPGGSRVYPELAAAGLWTTPSDLARFAIEVQSAGAGRGASVLRPESARLMLTPETYGPAGLGLVPTGSDGTLRFQQRGATAGFGAEMVAYVQRGQGAVVMVNGAGGGALIEEILNATATAYGWPDYVPPAKTIASVDPRVYDRYTGTYGVDQRSISVARRGPKLFLGPAGAERTELLPESVSDFFSVEGDAAYGFVFDETGKVSGLTVRRRSGEEYWIRTSLGM